MNYQKLLDDESVLVYLMNGVHYQLNKSTKKLQYEFIDDDGRRIWKDVEGSADDPRAKV